MIVHADHGYDQPRRVPQFIAHGLFNVWGYDSGVNAAMAHNTEGKWELEAMDNGSACLQQAFRCDSYFDGGTDGDGILDRLPPDPNAPSKL